MQATPTLRSLPIVILAVSLAFVAGELLAQEVIVDPRTRTYVIPTRVLWTSADETVENSRNLLQAGNGQVTLDEVEPCVMKQGGSLLLDFGANCMAVCKLRSGE